jgi:hypothetical protein
LPRAQYFTFSSRILVLHQPTRGRSRALVRAGLRAGLGRADYMIGTKRHEVAASVKIAVPTDRWKRTLEGRYECGLSYEGIRNLKTDQSSKLEIDLLLTSFFSSL